MPKWGQWPDSTVTHNDSKYLLQSAANTLNVLEIIAQNPNSSIVDIVNLSGIGKSTVFRILYTLESRNYVSRNETGKYKLGIKLFSFGKIVENQLGIIEIAHPFLEELCQATGETSHIAIWKNHSEIIFIDKVISTSSSLRMDSYIGYSNKAHLTASGKALLSTLADEQIEQYIAATDFQKFTDTTILSVEALRKEISEIRQRSYAVDNEECEIGLVCMATPLYDSFRHPIGSISFSGPASRMRINQQNTIPILLETARKLSAKL